ncbi:hypothetical protein ACFLWG_01785 [Chloroflexota bacterium]
MTKTNCDVKEWPPQSSKEQDADYLKRRKEALARLQLLLTSRKVQDIGNKINLFEFLP